MANCLLSTDWGNVADWAAVLVGVGAAVATTVVAVIAQRTSKRATEIAEEATKIAAQQHGEAVALREETARIIGRLLLHEVSRLPVRLQCITKALGEAGFQSGVINWAAAVHAAIADLDVPLLPSAELAEDRIHTLPPGLGADLAYLISHARDVRDGAARIHGIVDRASDFSSAKRDGDYVTQAMSQVNNFELQLMTVAEFANDFANEFHGFVFGEMQSPEKAD
ncbi:hypothetical protein [Stenotrophomonas sp. TWI1409]|uniref:hypothetical protein n=1 Tax=unclassified Stenotrophomonas TaxID=196198 RepID=UPI00320B47AC